MRKLGLALGGGGLKALAHIGVLQALESHGIQPAYISGSSGGSIFAALYASGMKPEQMAELLEETRPSDYLDYNVGGLIRYAAGLFLPGSHYPLQGIIKGRRLERLLYKWTQGKRLGQVKMPLAIIACDINSGQEVVFCNRPVSIGSRRVRVLGQALLSEAVRCSISIPGTFVPRQFRNMQMVDGGIRSMVPVWVQKALGADYILAIDLGEQEYHTPVVGMLAVIARSLDILTYETSEMDEKLYADMVILPGVEDVGLADIEQAGRIIARGREEMEKHIAGLLQALRQ